MSEPIMYGSKVCRALCLLYDLGPSEWMTEQDVSAAFGFRRVYHKALNRLADLEFAERRDSRGGYSYRITLQGQAYVLRRGWGDR